MADPLAYAVVATLWILFSDQAMLWVVDDADLLVQMSTAKGLWFVAVTALLLFVLIRRAFATIDTNRGFVDEIPMAALLLDPALQLRYANPAARDLLADEHEDVVGALAAGSEQADELRRFLHAASPVAARRFHLERPSGSAPHTIEVEATRVGDDLVAVLVHDTGEQHRITEALRDALHLQERANDELRQVTVLRDRFLTAVSHELRTPVTVVLGLAEALERLDATSTATLELRTELTSRLHVNAQRLARLLDDLLDLDRMSHGRLRLEPSEVELTDIVDLALEEIDLQDRDLAVDVPPIPVQVDRVRMSRVVANLLHNAVVHTAPSVGIRVHASTDADVVRLLVRDDGDGVPDEHKERIFGAFEQGMRPPTHRPGTGIGLSIVRQFVTLHGGRAWVEDTPGGGASFVVEFPRRLAAVEHLAG